MIKPFTIYSGHYIFPQDKAHIWFPWDFLESTFMMNKHGFAPPFGAMVLWNFDTDKPIAALHVKSKPKKPGPDGFIHEKLPNGKTLHYKPYPLFDA